MSHRPPLIFLHLPKTAGMTMRSVLAGRYPAGRTFVIGNDINGDIQRLTDRPEVERHRLDLLMGHMSHGLHELLRDRGADFLAPPHVRDGETRAFFRDPDGHLFEISELT